MVLCQDVPSSLGCFIYSSMIRRDVSPTVPSAEGLQFLFELQPVCATTRKAVYFLHLQEITSRLPLNSRLIELLVDSCPAVMESRLLCDPRGISMPFDFYLPYEAALFTSHFALHAFTR
ncbi:hypothetical protein AcW1_006763 [Taiwanofungus camphoratus]|nr:hypothetical protein AcV5_009352 [Antrodia cinnamomea]KAI0924736.1 hypothetical protein AcW2_005529 [Antrodia cinnamomea]KAI0953903.1 hypothetical protein AcV7_007303 [Antrodia cinnamomea]KAI0955072.1 hypothetical protein AcW1_006763 [Antrodia cinnamomea]